MPLNAPTPFSPSLPRQYDEPRLRDRDEDLVAPVTVEVPGPQALQIGPRVEECRPLERAHAVPQEHEHLTVLRPEGDDRRDIAFGAKNGEVFVFLGNGVGSFQRPALLYAGPDLEGLRARDLDGDGRDEILVPVAQPGLIILPGK